MLSGADLLYWRCNREQWASLAERAPDDAAAAYLHQVFEQTARAIDGLEKALAGLGLLQDALALDLHRPQDYFHRLWSLNFPARDLARTDSTRTATGAAMTRSAAPATRTAAALAARRQCTDAMLTRVTDAIRWLHRERRPVSFAAVARRAGVSLGVATNLSVLGRHGDVSGCVTADDATRSV